MMKGTEPESNALENVDFVVAAFGEAIGTGTIKSVQTAGFPVAQNRKASVKFRDINSQGMWAKRQQFLFGMVFSLV